jgi:hypothetical protein
MFRGFLNPGVAMSSISATSGSNYLTPQQLLQAELQQEVSSGAISSSDQSALSSALNDIGSALQGGSTDGAAAAGNTSHGDIKSKIDSLIVNEVSSGKLTSSRLANCKLYFRTLSGAQALAIRRSSKAPFRMGLQLRSDQSRLALSVVLAHRR